MEQNRDFQGQCSPLLSWLLNSCFPASVNTSLQGRECFGSSSNFLGEWPGGCCHHQGSLDLCTDLCQQSCCVFSLLFCILFFSPNVLCSATFNKIGLFICLCWSCLLLELLSGCHERGLHSSCGVRISHCSGFFCEAGALEHVSFSNVDRVLFVLRHVASSWTGMELQCRLDS